MLSWVKEEHWILLLMVSWVSKISVLYELISAKSVVLGVGKGTKKLTDFLDCTKVSRIYAFIHEIPTKPLGIHYNLSPGM